jgi:hypothetical protein
LHLKTLPSNSIPATKKEERVKSNQGLEEDRKVI